MVINTKLKVFSIFIIILFNVFLISAIPNDADNVINFEYPEPKFNNNTGLLNSSNIWITNVGDLDDVNSTQFSGTNGILSILESWIDGTYLRLDTANSPLTGDLFIEKANPIFGLKLSGAVQTADIFFQEMDGTTGGTLSYRGDGLASFPKSFNFATFQTGGNIRFSSGANELAMTLDSSADVIISNNLKFESSTAEIVASGDEMNLTADAFNFLTGPVKVTNPGSIGTGVIIEATDSDLFASMEYRNDISVAGLQTGLWGSTHANANDAFFYNNDGGFRFGTTSTPGSSSTNDRLLINGAGKVTVQNGGGGNGGMILKGAGASSFNSLDIINNLGGNGVQVGLGGSTNGLLPSTFFNWNNVGGISWGTTDGSFAERMTLEGNGDLSLTGDNYNFQQGASDDISLTFNVTDRVVEAQVGTPSAFWKGFKTYFFDSNVDVDGNVSANNYFGDGSNLRNISSEKVWTFKSPSGSAGRFYYGGFYNFGSSDNDFNPSITHGTANSAYGAHFFVVCAAGGSGGTDTVINVSGTSITDEGVRTASYSQLIVMDDAGSAGDYNETSKKWLGQVTVVKLSGPDLLCNYGFAKYWDNNNNNFTIEGLEATWLGGANDANPDIILRHHKATGWTYNSGSEPTPPAAVASMDADYGTESQIVNNENGAYKRVDLSEEIEGSGGEGTIIEIVTTANKAIELGNIILRIKS